MATHAPGLALSTPPTQPTAGLARSAFRPGLSQRHLRLCLMVGILAALLSVGGRWDFPIAAWVAAPLLLRFTRASSPSRGLPTVWLVTVGAALFWMWQLAVPAAPMTFVGAAVLGTMTALPFMIDRVLAPRTGLVGELLALPAAMAVSQFTIGTLFPFGTAFGLSAVSQRGQLSLLQVVAIAGPYSIAVLIGAFAAAAETTWARGFSLRTSRPLTTVVAVIVAVAVAGQARLAFFPASSTPTVRIAGLNPSRPSLENAERTLGVKINDWKGMSRIAPTRLTTAFQASNLGLLRQTAEAADAGAKIILWAENAARVPIRDEEVFLRQAAAVARQHKAYVNMAINVILTKAPYIRDETVMIDPTGTVRWTYQKSHPIPGLEPQPPGDGKVPVLRTPYGRLASVICFDADFPSLLRVPADIMLVPGSDWPEIGRTHTQMASIRAIENGYSLVRQDYDGSSQAFDFNGHVLSQRDTTSRAEQLPWYVDVPTRGTATPYRQLGDWLAWLSVLALLGLSVTAVRNRVRLSDAITRP